MLRTAILLAFLAPSQGLPKLAEAAIFRDWLREKLDEI